MVAIVVLARLGVSFLTFRSRRKSISLKVSGGATAREYDGNYDGKEVAAGYSSYAVDKHYHSKLDGQVPPTNELPGV